jgi:hypothetical protein
MERWSKRAENQSDYIPYYYTIKTVIFYLRMCMDI